ncbi:hypothetical protein [Actinomadura verrucosospora]|uniref:hypothetical protein n=1 Tax=Actinomadura verrucosospora TaxID=46165 RepID=UPI0015669B85|nr:hypothetical protein [Actinomadura verrucosospora]
MNDRTPLLGLLAGPVLGRRLVSAARAVLWAQAVLLVSAGAAMVAYGEAATGSEAQVGAAMMFLAVYPFALAIAAVALAAAFRGRRSSTRGCVVGYEVFLLLVAGPFAGHPDAGVAALGVCAVVTTSFVIAVMASRAGAAHFAAHRHLSA